MASFGVPRPGRCTRRLMGTRSSLAGTVAQIWAMWQASLTRDPQSWVDEHATYGTVATRRDHEVARTAGPRLPPPATGSRAKPGGRPWVAVGTTSRRCPWRSDHPSAAVKCRHAAAEPAAQTSSGRKRPHRGGRVTNEHEPERRADGCPPPGRTGTVPRGRGHPRASASRCRHSERSFRSRIRDKAARSGTRWSGGKMGARDIVPARTRHADGRPVRAYLAIGPRVHGYRSAPTWRYRRRPEGRRR